MLQAVFSLVPSKVGGTRPTDQSGRTSSRSLHKVGLFDVIDKHLGSWGKEAQLIFFILAVVPSHCHPSCT